MKKTAYIISVKCAFGSHKEFVLFGKQMKKRGLAVRYILSRNYAWMHTEPIEEVHFLTNSTNMISIAIDTVLFFLYGWIRLALIFRKEPPDFLCFYNAHPLNFAIAGLAKKFAPDGIRAVYLHEPARPEKAAYAWKGRLYFNIVEFCQRLVLESTTDVILGSPVAMELFEQHFPDYPGQKHYAPLLITDCPSKVRKRRYFSMVGRFNFAKKPDIFIEAINYAAQRGEDIEFQIVTSCNIERFLALLTPDGKSRLRLVIKKNLSDKDISQAVAGSFAVLSLQPIVTQSGILPVAFMNSTPLIVRPIRGFTQFVEHTFNGWVLPKDFSIQDIVEAMKLVRDNFDSLSANARHTFLDLFAEENWNKYYDRLLNPLNGVQTTKLAATVCAYPDK